MEAGKLIKEYRTKNKLNLKQMGQLAGLTDVSICRLENGKQAMTIKVARTLEKTTGVPASKWAFPEERGEIKNGKIPGHDCIQ